MTNSSTPEPSVEQRAMEMLAAEYRRRNIKTADWIALYPEHDTAEVIAALAAITRALQSRTDIEREIVEWLRKGAAVQDASSPRWRIADAIESGEYRREGR